LQSLKLVVLNASSSHGLSQVRPIGIGEPSRFAGQSHRLHIGQSGIGDVEQGILLGGIQGNAVFTAHGGIDKLDDDFVPQVLSLKIAIAPSLEWVGAGCASTFLRRTQIASSTGM
jgi:hypothetical protein